MAKKSILIIVLIVLILLPIGLRSGTRLIREADTARFEHLIGHVVKIEETDGWRHVIVPMDRLYIDTICSNDTLYRWRQAVYLTEDELSRLIFLLSLSDVELSRLVFSQDISEVWPDTLRWHKAISEDTIKP